MIVIITARKGSKRCPRKNILPFLDTNIVRKTLDDANHIALPGKIVLTTDYPLGSKLIDPEYGQCLYLVRAERLCTDEAGHVDVIIDALAFWSQSSVDGELPDSFVLMQPTSANRNLDTLYRALTRWERDDIPALVSVNPAYQPNGSFYFCRTDAFLDQRTLFPKGSHFWKCSWEESIDINYQWDFRIAEALVRGDVHGQ